MLLCGIINDLEKDPGINSNLCYFFCQATDNRINTAIAAVGGLIFSLLEQRQTFFLDIRNRFANKISQLSGPNAWQVLNDIFEAITHDQSLPNVVCVVDALDECEHGIKLLLSLIVKTSHHIKWLFSSRNVKEIEQGLRSIDDSRRLVLELIRNAKCVSQSVDAYIDDSIRDIAALTDDEDLRMKTADTLKFKADGTFLWVSLVVEQLRDTDRRNIEDVLEELPVGLENLYDLIMKRITQKLRKKDQNVCHILLAIVTTAERPLRLEELLEFIKFQWKDFKGKYDVRDMKDMVKDCGSFLSIKDGTVYLVHQSVKDYVVGKGAKTIFPLGVEHQHSEMFKNSLYSMSYILTYNMYHIKTPAGCSVSRPCPDPLAPIAYCCIFWAEHLFQSCQFEKTNVEEFLKDNGTLHCFLKDKFLCWLEALSLLKHEAFTQGVAAIDKVKSIISRHCKGQTSQYDIGAMRYAPGEKGESGLGVFIDDAWKFIRSCKEYVRNSPLQLYYTPFVFGDNDNTINKTFQQTIHAKFGHLPTFDKPRRQFSCMQVIRPETSFNFLLFSPDSSLLCVAQENDTISLWRTTSGILEHEIELNADVKGMETNPQLGIDHHIAFSTDSSTLVSVSGAGVVQRWSINNQTRVQRHRLKFMDGTERVITLSQNGDLAASVKTGGIAQLIVWTTKTGDHTQAFRLENTSNIFNAAFSPNSALIALIDESGVTIYSIHAGKDIQRLQRPLALKDSQRHEYRTMSMFSPNSEYFAYVYDSRNIQLWCTNTWTMMQRITLENFSRMDQFAFSPNSLAFIIRIHANLLFGSTATGQYQRYVLSPASAATAAKITMFSPSRSWTNSSCLLATGNGQTVETWLVDTTDALDEAHNTDIRSGGTIYLSPDSKLIAALDCWNYDINIIAAERGEIVRTLKRKGSLWDKLAFSPNSRFLAGRVGGTADVHIWDVNTGTVMQELQGQGYSRIAVAFSYDSRYLVTGYDNGGGYNQNYSKGLVRIWHVESGHNLYEFGCELRSNGISAMAISTDLKFVAICDFGYEVQIWELLAGHCVYKINQLFANDVKFSSDSKSLAVMQWEPDRVQIWEIATGVCLFCLETGYGLRDIL